MTGKKIDKETVLTGALIDIREIAEEVLKRMAVSELEKPKEIEEEEVPEIVSEEDADLSKPIVSKVSFGDPEDKADFSEDFQKIVDEAVKKKDEQVTVSIEGKPSEERDYIQLEDLRKNMEMKETAKEWAGDKEGAIPTTQIPKQKEAKLLETTIKPAMMETTNKCPKCNSKLKHTSTVERIGDGFFATNTATCTNKGKKTLFKRKVVREPCDYVSKTVSRID